jgi:hypothetical protein
MGIHSRALFFRIIKIRKMSVLKSKKFHKSYLRITAIGIAAFGPVFFLGSMLPTSAPAAWTLDFLSWPVDGAQRYDAPTTRFLSALTGGFLMGWGTTVWCLQKWVYDIAPEAVRKSVLAGVLCWFVFDSAGSIASGNPSNAIFNVIVLIICAGPLWWQASEE